ALPLPGLSFCFASLCPPLGSGPFPYTTLFRSFLLLLFLPGCHCVTLADLLLERGGGLGHHADLVAHVDMGNWPRFVLLRHGLERSEEHTSELQSRENLVCRLLLEKKKY